MNNKPAKTSLLTRPETIKNLTVLIAVFAALGIRGLYAQEPPRSQRRAGDHKLVSDISDKAGLFDSGVIEAARKELRRVEGKSNVVTVIQTVESLDGQKIAEAANRGARHAEIQGIFVLIAKDEKELELLVSKKYLGMIGRSRQEAIRSAFLDGFKKRDFDAGLKQGVAAIADQLADVRHDGDSPGNDSAAAALGFTSAAPASAGASSPLVIKNQVRLGLAGARAIIAAAEAKALDMKLKVNVAVVDDGGHLLALERMDDARPASLYTAITKATSAATFRQPTGPLAAGTTPADPLLNISLQNAALASGGKITALYGGVPVVVEKQTIGAVGIAGGTGEQDAQVARAAVQAFIDQLAKTEAPTTTAKAVEKPE